MSWVTYWWEHWTLQTRRKTRRSRRGNRNKSKIKNKIDPLTHYLQAIIITSQWAIIPFVKLSMILRTVILISCLDLFRINIHRGVLFSYLLERSRKGKIRLSGMLINNCMKSCMLMGHCIEGWFKMKWGMGMGKYVILMELFMKENGFKMKHKESEFWLLAD